MNNVFTFVGTFVISFIIATGGVYFMNNQFYNIWDFDFRSLNQVLEEQKAAAVDSVKTVDHKEENVIEQQPATEEQTSNKTVEKTEKTNKSKNTRTSKPKIEKPKPQPAQVKNEQVSEEQIDPESTVDSSYVQWAKQTAKIYESMDAASAAKIIQNYSDSVARDIIYSMNKKKAAGILAVLDPKVATRITRAN